MSNRFEKSGITGKIVEYELFGKSHYERITREAPPDYRYLSYEQSIDLVKKLQPHTPNDPKPDFANSVHREIAGKLKIDPKLLRFYTAIDSPLDFYHKIDGWFEILKGGQRIRVTIDLTTNPNKESSTRTDIVFDIPHDGLDAIVDNSQFLEYTNKLATEVAMFFNDRGIRPMERRAS